MTIEADPNMFSFILRNLITNCIRFLESGQKLSFSSTLKEANGGEGLEFALHLPSEGFPPALLEATRAKIKENGPHGTKGLGLGLSLSLDFVKALNGEINFENLAGR